MIPWTALQEQFGQEYTRIRKFREFFLDMLRKMHATYPQARFEIDAGGMRAYHSPPPVPKRLIAVECAIQGAGE